MVKSILSSEIQRINFGFFKSKLQFCNRNYDFALFPEIGISRVLQVNWKSEFNNLDLNSSICSLLSGKPCCQRFEPFFSCV